MFDFILTILIAVIIFGPAVMIILKFFGLSSDQARDSFYDLVDEIEDLAENGEEGDERIFLLIMDEGSYVAKFDRQTTFDSSMSMQVSPGTWLGPLPLSYLIPSSCGDNECFVFCKKTRYKQIPITYPNFKYEASCTTSKIVEIDSGIKITPFLIAMQTPETSSEIENMPERIVRDSIHYVSLRRSALKLKKVSSGEESTVEIENFGEQQPLNAEERSELIEDLAQEIRTMVAESYVVETPAVTIQSGEMNYLVVRIRSSGDYTLNTDYGFDLTMTPFEELGLTERTYRYGSAFCSQNIINCINRNEISTYTNELIEYRIPIQINQEGSYEISGNIQFDITTLDGDDLRASSHLTWDVIVTSSE